MIGREVESKHTPGPWGVVDRRHQKGGQLRIVPEGKREDRDDYATIANALALNPKAQANARLIAAAPDLLEACKALANWCDRLGLPWPSHLPIGSALALDADLGRARDAIAKAQRIETTVEA